MFGWLNSIFNRGPRHQARSSRLEGTTPVGLGRRFVLHNANVDHIEAALIGLANVGLKLTPSARGSLRATAERIAVEYEGYYFSSEPTPRDWVMIVLDGGSTKYFENAVWIQDHCYDCGGVNEYPEIISSIIALAGDEWQVEGVHMTNVIGLKAPVTIAIKAKPEVPPFEIMADKDFDWSVVFRLNERLPEGALGRFALFLDGNGTIVFLTPGQIQQLNSLCGYDFHYQEYPEGQQTKT
jgi:hypothetical protein